MGKRRIWSRTELLVCLAVYATLTPKDRRVPPTRVLEHLASMIGRSSDSISLRFANFNSVDPIFTSQGLLGMTGGGAHVSKIWNEFSNNEGDLDIREIVRELVTLIPIEPPASEEEY